MRQAGNDSLEEDADWSAVGAVVSLWGGAKGMLAGIAQGARPRLLSGLSLRRCGDAPQKESGRKLLTEPREESYGALLTEAAQDLERVDFGRAEKTKRAHVEYWDVIEPPAELKGGKLVRDESKYKLILKKDKKLSEALDGLVRDALEAKSRDVWLTASLDCAQFVQAMHLISVRQRLGSDLFDKEVEGIQKKMGQFEITADYSGLHYLALVTPTRRYSREGGGSAPSFKEYTWKDGRWDGGTEVPPEKTEDQLLKDAPIGSRVTWKNEAAAPSSSFGIENSIKVADDRYAAHGLPDPEGTTEKGKNIYTRLEIGKALAPSKEAVRKEFGATEDADKWIGDYIKKYIFVTEIEHYKFPEPPAKGAR